MIATLMMSTHITAVIMIAIMIYHILKIILQQQTKQQNQSQVGAYYLKKLV
jgi:hypothetical protein